MLLRKRFYDFPELNIHGDFRDACGAFLNMTWHYNEAVKSEIEKNYSRTEFTFSVFKYAH